MKCTIIKGGQGLLFYLLLVQATLSTLQYLQTLLNFIDKFWTKSDVYIFSFFLNEGMMKDIITKIQTF